MNFTPLLQQHGLYPTVFAVCVVSGFIPAVSAEIFLLIVMAAVPQASPVLVGLTAACGQMVAKSLIYATGRGLVRMPLRNLGNRLRKVHDQMLHHKAGVFALMFVSALTGIPPYYVVSFAAGVLETPFPPFFAAGFAGRMIRFTLFAAFPELVRRLMAQ